MALTQQQEAILASVADAVASSGLDGPAVAKTLKLGKLTTEIAEIEAKIANADAAFDQEKAAHAAALGALRDQADAKRAELRTLTGN